MKDYKKGDVQAKARASIAKQFEGCSPLDVKDRWTYLKDQFRKARKIANHDDRSGTGTEDSKKCKKVWIFYNQMSFLIPHSFEPEFSSISQSATDGTEATTKEGNNNEDLSQENSQNRRAQKFMDLFENGLFYDENGDFVDEGPQNSTDNISVDLHSDLITIYEDDDNTNNSSNDLETSLSYEQNSKKKKKCLSFKSPSTPSPTPGKRGKRHATNDNFDSEFGSILSSLKDIAKSKPEVFQSMQISSPILNPIQQDWTSFCQNFALRVADLPDEDSRDAIRMGMENLYWQNKKKKLIANQFNR
ncbi:Uncharacterized protein APZ42_029623 [Daphnia magna]|uniref:MADF domain-containing protein n=1 Tax=Daphnia magna TaxID=35525 RepID=A0A164PG30_9CRUS|nr:Uncharacterized protein APZ42_029623 [Daphnia magna]